MIQATSLSCEQRKRKKVDDDRSICQPKPINCKRRWQLLICPWKRETVPANPSLADYQRSMERPSSSTRLSTTTRPSPYRCRRHFPQSGKSQARSINSITPSGECPICTPQNRVSSANLLMQQTVRNNGEYPPTSSTQSGDADSRAGNSPQNAINRPSASSAQSKRKADSIGNASQTATNKVRVTMVEDGSRKVTKIRDLLN